MKKCWLVVSLLLVAALFAGCGPELPSVNVQSVSMITGYGSAGEFNVCAGVAVAQDEVKIERDESRKVKELKVKAGQEIREGEVLFVYDTEEMQLTIDKARLEIEQLKNSVTDYDTQIAQLEKEKGRAPASEQLSYTVQIQSLQADKKEAQYNITVKERELETLEASSENGEVLSPADGKVQTINENGGYDNMTGEPLPYISIIRSGAYRIKGTINELNRAEYYEGMPVRIRSRADATQTWTGMIEQIDMDSPGQNNNNNGWYYGATDDMTNSSNYPFYVSLDSTDGLMLGQHVYIEPENGQQGADDELWLSADYVVMADTDGYYVWAADDDDRLERRTVQVGGFDEERNAYLITDGLGADDYIAYPDETAQKGAPVVRNDDFTASDGGEDFFGDNDNDGFAVEPIVQPEPGLSVTTGGF